jgi:methyltransferase-like protein
VFPPEVQQTLRDISADLVEMEQYLDFLKNRTFRRTLLVHDHVVLNRSPPGAIVEKLLVTGMARPASARSDVTSTAAEEFHNEDGASVTSAVPLVKAALTVLFETWPRVYRFEELLAAVLARLAGTPGDLPVEQARALLGRSLGHLYLTNLVGLHAHVPAFALAASERPRASPMVRVQARAGATISNRRHKQVQMPIFDRAVLSFLDGTRDRAALVEALTKSVLAGELELRCDGRVLTDPGEVGAALAGELEESLTRMARALLLLE